MAYYNNSYSDADQYPPNYHYYHNHQYIHYNHNQYNDYQYNNYRHHYATPQTLAPQSYYYYSDGFNCYQAGNDCYSYGYFPVAYNSVAGSSQPKRVELEGGGVKMDSIENREDAEDDDDEEAYDDFDDYDPTPYDGGYDIVMVYGKPLPASDAICYPRSGAGGNDSEVPVNVVSDQPVSEATVPMNDFECHNGNDHSECESEPCCDSEISDADKKVSGRDVVKLSGHDFDEEYSYEGEREYEKVMVSNGDEAPNANELISESPGFSDGLYGYLPCLNKKKKNRTIVESGDYGWVDMPEEDPWKAAADFIFGSLNPYAD